MYLEFVFENKLFNFIILVALKPQSFANVLMTSQLFNISLNNKIKLIC